MGKLDRSDRRDVKALLMNERSVTLSHRGVVTVSLRDKNCSMSAKKKKISRTGKREEEKGINLE